MAKLPSGRMFIRAIALQSCYKHLLCVIHARLVREVLWNRRDGQRMGDNIGGNDLKKSLDVGMEAARSIILLTRYVDVDNYTPSW